MDKNSLTKAAAKTEAQLTKEIHELRAQLKETKKKLAAILETQIPNLKSFFDSSITPLVLLDKNFYFVKVNKAYAKACGRDISEFPGHNHFEFYPDDENQDIFRQVVKTKTPFQAFEKTFIFPDHPEWGTTYWDWILTPLPDQKGDTQYLVFSLNDVTGHVEAKKTLQLHANRYATMLATTPDGFLAVDIDGKFLDTNDTYCRMSGYSREEILLLSIPDIEAVENPEETARRIRKIAQTGFDRFESQHRRKDGRIFDVEISISFCRVSGNFLLFVRDISIQKQAQRSIATERRRLSEVLESLPVYVILLTPDHRVAFTNRIFEQRFGKCEGLICYQYLFNRNEPCENCGTYKCLDKNAPHRWEWNGPDNRCYDVFDYPFRDTDGSPLILEMGIDITERKKAEEALKTAHLYNRGLIEASPDPLVTINPDGKITDVNRSTELMTGVSRDKLIGTDFGDYFTDPEKAKEGYKEVFLKGTVRDYPLALKDQNGNVTEVLYNATLYRNGAGVVEGVFAAARDVTERNEIQRRTHATNDLLSLFSQKPSRKEYLDAVVELLNSWSGCRCVGIRIVDDKGYIFYESFVGFSQEFWESENRLSLKHDQCVCIRVVTENPAPQDVSMLTPGGSFHCGDTRSFVDRLSAEEKAMFRGVCIQHGFLSLNVVPIRYGTKVLGTIHLADEEKNKLSSSFIEFLESMSPLIGEALNRFNLKDELRESENRLRFLSSQLLTVQENERKRISAELHDDIAAKLAGIKFCLEKKMIEVGKTENEANQSLKDIISMVLDTIVSTRRIMINLRPAMIDDLGILATLNWYCREFEKIFTDIKVEKQINIEEIEIPDHLKIVIFRIVQEGMNNIAKHSGANTICLALKKTNDILALSLEDNGWGFDKEQDFLESEMFQGFGMINMKERTRLSGGDFSINSEKGKGTFLKATWPLKQKEMDHHLHLRIEPS